MISGTERLRLGVSGLVLAFLAVPAAVLVLGGDWRHARLASGDLTAVFTSLFGGIAALLIIVLLGTPLALSLARGRGAWGGAAETLVLIPMLTPTLALGILLAAAYGPAAPLGAAIARLGVVLTNSPPAFVLAGVYAALPTYVIAAKSAFAQVPPGLEDVARTLGERPAGVFFKVTLPLARRPLSAALALAWVRALGEFGIVLLIAYYPAGMPVQLWTDFQELGLPSVFPLLALFLIVTLPVPLWLGLQARRRGV